MTSFGVTYRPTSKAGDAMGEISVEMLKVPSNLRSGNGVVTSAEMQTETLSNVSFPLVWQELPSRPDVLGSSQFNIDLPIFFTKSELDRTICI